VNPADPTAAEFGVSEMSVGTGLGATLILTAFEVEGPGLVTVIDSEPTDARSAAGIVADKKLEFQPLTVMLEPFTWTVEKEMKPEP
jgi:predicted O-methyltransferase YrrM